MKAGLRLKGEQLRCAEEKKGKVLLSGRAQGGEGGGRCQWGQRCRLRPTLSRAPPRERDFVSSPKRGCNRVLAEPDRVTYVMRTLTSPQPERPSSQPQSDRDGECWCGGRQPAWCGDGEVRSSLSADVDALEMWAFPRHIRGTPTKKEKAPLVDSCPQRPSVFATRPRAARVVRVVRGARMADPFPRAHLPECGCPELLARPWRITKTVRVKVPQGILCRQTSRAAWQRCEVTARQ